MVSNGALRGGGDTTPGLYAAIITLIGIAVPLAWLLAHPLGFGSTGVWVALAIGITANGAILGFRWRSGRWIEVALVSSELYRKLLHKYPRPIIDDYLENIRAVEMKVDGTVEVVEENGVWYERDDGKIWYQFDANGYLPKEKFA